MMFLTSTLKIIYHKILRSFLYINKRGWKFLTALFDTIFIVMKMLQFAYFSYS